MTVLTIFLKHILQPPVSKNTFWKLLTGHITETLQPPSWDLTGCRQADRTVCTEAQDSLTNRMVWIKQETFPTFYPCSLNDLRKEEIFLCLPHWYTIFYLYKYVRNIHTLFARRSNSSSPSQKSTWWSDTASIVSSHCLRKEIGRYSCYSMIIYLRKDYTLIRKSWIGF